MPADALNGIAFAGLLRTAIQSTAIVKPVGHRPILGIEALRGLVGLVAQYKALAQASPDHPREATSCLINGSPPRCNSDNLLIWQQIRFCRINHGMIHLHSYLFAVIDRSFRIPVSSHPVQVDALSACNHPAQCPRVLPLRLELSGFGRNDGGAWPVG